MAKLIGYIGFHEYDEFIPIMSLRNTLKRLTAEMNTHLFCLKTANGYYFITFKIMDNLERTRWAFKMIKEFPSNFKQDAEHRVLRLSNKGNYPKPSLLSCYTKTTSGNDISAGHIEAYIEQGIIPSEIAEQLLNDNNVIKTQCMTCEYLARVK